MDEVVQRDLEKPASKIKVCRKATLYVPRLPKFLDSKFCFTYIMKKCIEQKLVQTKTSMIVLCIVNKLKLLNQIMRTSKTSNKNASY
jgi:hypothetical protein